MATTMCWSKIVRSSSFIVLLVVAVALPVAPIIAHQSDELMMCANMSDPRCFVPALPSGRHRPPHQPPCTSCPYAGACPWCHV
ncbi:hypothetical protein PVAP13_8NG335142 [Panicum virgatum]|uniref:Uncharacterized protein n=1 Tax=Panicum virgatum TaxID=38727 RepID=A0A8T0PAN3_PANVG|nr:hypothetical protein PVAP13_8NG335142 [Panicum virgatum]